MEYMIKMDRDLIMLIVAFLSFMLVIFAIGVFAVINEINENNCIKINKNNDGSYDYNNIIKCCIDIGNYESYCLKTYKPGYKE